MKFRTVLMLVGGAFALLGGYWYFRHRDGRAGEVHAVEAEPAPVAVTVEAVATRPVNRLVWVVGSLYGRDEIAIVPKVDGRVVKIFHDVGDVVTPGEPLLEIDRTDYQLAALEARRALELELAKIGLKEPPGRQFNLMKLPAVIRSESLEANAGAKLDRMRKLWGNRGVAKEEVEQAETDFEVAKANFEQSKMEAEVTLAAVRHRQAMLETAEQRLRDTRVIVPTPSAGNDRALAVVGAGAAAAPVVEKGEYVVCQRGIAEGEYVRNMPGANTVLFRLVVDRPLKLQVTVPERYRAEVKSGQDAALEVESHPGKRFPGKVSRINPTVDRASRTFQVEILVPNEDRRLSPGSFAKAAIFTKIDPKARTIPEEALVTFAGITKVFVVEGGRTREVHVKPGARLQVPGPVRQRTWIEVEGDLPEGATVATSGHSQLSNGAAVRVRTPAAPREDKKSP